MTTEISAEAKLAIANGALIRARNRLRNDGCSSDDAFRKRVLLRGNPSPSKLPSREVCLQRRSTRKRNRQRLAAHAKRLMR
jgi:hypothetical protein